jgi:uncharacterized heparinase superfamily protein
MHWTKKHGEALSSLETVLEAEEYKQLKKLGFAAQTNMLEKCIENMPAGERRASCQIALAHMLLAQR